MGIFNYSNPADDAMKYLDQIPSELSQTLQPYIDAGAQALPYMQSNFNMLSNMGAPLSQQTQNMYQNPAGAYNSISSQYQQSPAYQWQYDQGQQAAQNAANAGGYAGDPQAQQYSAELGSDMANKDFYNWMSQVLGLGKYGMNEATDLYKTGLQGESSLYNTGAQSSSQLAQGLLQTLMEQAGLSYAGTANQNQHAGGLAGGAIGGITTGLSSLMKPKSASTWINPDTLFSFA